MINTCASQNIFNKTIFAQFHTTHILTSHFRKRLFVCALCFIPKQVFGKRSVLTSDNLSKPSTTNLLFSKGWLAIVSSSFKLFKLTPIAIIPGLSSLN